VVEDRKQLEKILLIKDKIPTPKAIVQVNIKKSQIEKSSNLTFSFPSAVFRETAC